MSQYARKHPDEATLHDAFAGQHRSPLIPRGEPVATVTRENGFIMVRPAVPVNGTKQLRAFENAQAAANWLELNMPGQVCFWEVRP